MGIPLLINREKLNNLRRLLEAFLSLDLVARFVAGRHLQKALTPMGLAHTTTTTALLFTCLPPPPLPLFFPTCHRAGTPTNNVPSLCLTIYSVCGRACASHISYNEDN